MLKRRVLLPAVMSAALVASLLALPTAVSAQSTGAYLDGAEPWTESDCAGETPIVVGSDTKAQSDIYSAVTLAGVVGTDCVVLAGPRDGDMSADQLARLDGAATGGYVLGGTAAVPEAKVARRNLTRLGGATRWATAQLIGSQARALAGGQAPDAPSVPSTTLSAPSDVEQPGVFLHGAEPWIASDCSGDVPIVVGSDAKAQSDIYSAVTLAGVVGTDCVVLAGPRDGDVPASQRTRLSAAEAGGYVLGGIAAVPTAKIAGRDMMRLGGTTRWQTAQLVGRRASGDTTAGTSTTAETPVSQATSPDTSATFAAVAVAIRISCGIRTDGSIECWGDDDDLMVSGAPSGEFNEIALGNGHGCAIRPDDTVECWGTNHHGESDAPTGRFSEVWVLEDASCGLRKDMQLRCWGRLIPGSAADVPSGKFTAVSLGSAPYSHSCGVRTNGTVECWGIDNSGETAAPSDKFIDVAVGGDFSCGVRTDRTITCWGFNRSGVNDAPVGEFSELEVSANSGCGLRVDGEIRCWGSLWGTSDAPAGKFLSIATSWGIGCAIRADGTIACWGNRDVRQLDAPSGKFTGLAVAFDHSCAIRIDRTVQCWGRNTFGQSDPGRPGYEPVPGIPDPVPPNEAYLAYQSRISVFLEECGWWDTDRGGYRQCEDPGDTQTADQITSDFFGCEFDRDVSRCKGMSFPEFQRHESGLACPSDWFLSPNYGAGGRYEGHWCFRHDHPDREPLDGE